MLVHNLRRLGKLQFVRHKAIRVSKNKSKAMDYFLDQLLNLQSCSREEIFCESMRYDFLVKVSRSINNYIKQNRNIDFPQIIRDDSMITYFFRMLTLNYMEFEHTVNALSSKFGDMNNDTLEAAGLSLLNLRCEYYWDNKFGLVARFHKAERSNKTNFAQTLFTSGANVRISTRDMAKSSIVSDVKPPLEVIKGVVLDARMDHIDIAVPTRHIGFVSLDALFRIDSHYNESQLFRISEALTLFLDGGHFTSANDIRDMIISSYSSSMLKYANTQGLRNSSSRHVLPSLGTSKISNLDDRQLLDMIPTEYAINKISLLIDDIRKGNRPKVNSSSQGSDNQWFKTSECSSTDTNRYSHDSHSLETNNNLFCQEFSIHTQIPIFTECVIDKHLEPFRRCLNDSQLSAVENAVKTPFTLIQGPPGTGKTQTAACILAVITSLQRKAHVCEQFGKEYYKLIEANNLFVPGKTRHIALACAQTNAAADNIVRNLKKHGVSCLRLGRLTSVHEDVRSVALETRLHSNDNWLELQDRVMKEWRALSEMSEGDIDSRSGRSKRRTAQTTADELFELESQVFLDSLKTVDVVVTTCYGAGSDLVHNIMWSRTLSKQFRFSTVLIDEASQCVETSVLSAISLGCERLILIGDQNQLPPLVLSDDANSRGLGVSLFHRMVIAGAKPFLLNTQYRMEPTIAAFSSKQFYDSVLLSAKSATKLDKNISGVLQWPNRNSRALFIDVSHLDFANKWKELHLKRVNDIRQDDAAHGFLDSSKCEDAISTPSWISGFEKARSNGFIENSSCWNEFEADCVVALLDTLLLRTDHCNDVVYCAQPSEKSKIGVISPYRAQVDRLRDKCAERGWHNRNAGFDRLSHSELTNILSDTINRESLTVSPIIDEEPKDSRSLVPDMLRIISEKPTYRTKRIHDDKHQLEIDTVDAFQGREKDIIIISTVRSNERGDVGFLDDWRRLNVAVTRAKEMLIVVGDMSTLSNDVYWKSFLEYCSSNGNIIKLNSLEVSRVDAFHACNDTLLDI